MGQNGCQTATKFGFYQWNIVNFTAIPIACVYVWDAFHGGKAKKCSSLVLIFIPALDQAIYALKEKEPGAPR